MKKLKLYWSRSKPNFGDCLSPIICEMLSRRPIVYAGKRECDLVALGSLLDRFRESWFHPKVHIWGTGFIEKVSPRRTRFHYHALRGRHSAGLLKGCETEVFGDPGLLADRIWPELKKSKKKYHIGIIPHYEDRELSSVGVIADKFRKVTVINAFDDVKTVIATIAACEFVFSSSLHGLVVSDAFGVPNAWMKLSDKVCGNNFKFYDYYSAFDIPLQKVKPFTINAMLSLKDKDVEVLKAKYERPSLHVMKEKLVGSFPFSN
ncbi:MAG: polysaccharide pyruvyl transferase family protein [Deltaproteobacteria bacterium]|nr:polysaccharide pyruvyl transferase family protein [Deltaproteobacteria bacterium]